MWYEYTVDGRRYLGSNYRNGGNVSELGSTALAVAKRYPVGCAVALFYSGPVWRGWRVFIGVIRPQHGSSTSPSRTRGGTSSCAPGRTCKVQFP